MQRTYKSKKNNTGAFDPRDAFLADDKSSAFDAFYIQNIKQTKRELSCRGVTNQVNAGNKVRKRKYVKRIAKVSEEPKRDSVGNFSTFLTPDKSIHVKREGDLFDQLLNSSAPQNSESKTKNDLFNQLKLSKKQTKTCCNRVRRAVRKYNYSTSDSDESEKENRLGNTSRNNMTDIRQYKLVFEKDTTESADLTDDSIHKLVNNLSFLKQQKTNEMARNKNRLTQNIVGTERPESPLCSTPFLDKYRGKSIYNFSPIAGLNDSVNALMNNSKNYEDGEIMNDSKCSNNEHSQRADITPPSVYESMISPGGNDNSNPKISPASEDKEIIESPVKNVETFDSSNTIENSGDQTPFLGFTNTTGLDKILHNSIKACRVSTSSCQSPILNKPSKKYSDKNKSMTTSSCNRDMSVVEQEYIEVNNSTEHSIEMSVEQEPFLGFSRVSNEHQIIDIGSTTDESINSSNANETIMETEINKDNLDTNDSNNSADAYDSADSYRQSLYDTCVSEESNLSEDGMETDPKIPLVVLERMNTSLFKKYNKEYENKNSSLEDANDLTVEDFDETVVNAYIEGTDNLSEKSEVDNTDSNDEAEAQSNGVKKHVSFVTTRRRVIANDSMIMLSDDSVSSNNSSEFDKTVVSNHAKTEIQTDTNNELENKDSLENHYEEAKRSLDLAEGFCSFQEEDNESRPLIVLQPGKKWERSLSICRRMTLACDNSLLEEDTKMKGRKYRQSIIHTMELQENGPLHNESFRNRRNTCVRKSHRATFRILKEPNKSRLSLHSSRNYDLTGFLTDDCNDTLVELSKLSIGDPEGEVTVIDKFDEAPDSLTSARDYVLRRCDQTEAILFDECYPDAILKNCHKIGEGVYGEVFLWRARDGVRVMKIVPVGGTTEINGEHQKDFQEIISEIVIAMELSALRTPLTDVENRFDESEGVKSLDLRSVENATDIFNEVLAVRCVVGNYPSRLLDLWELYDEAKGSENENPAILPADQQYIVLELANAGQDLESYQFNSAEQAHALFLQIAYGLAVAEEAYQFEHRDLHWGNVLIAPTDQKWATFILRGVTHRVPRRGVKATIIDYSLSRLSLPLAGDDRVALYDDLTTHAGLFDATGDYQFTLYRLMRDKTGNDWKIFEPYTNILWLHYTVDKMITALRYKRTNTKIHKHYIAKLKGIKNRILDYRSCVQFVLTDNEF